jgi:hypothetical protein
MEKCPSFEEFMSEEVTNGQSILYANKKKI